MRLDLYRKRRRVSNLDLAAWKRVLDEAQSLGCADFHISGGEPTLYAYLSDIVLYAKKWGMTVNINTNGSPVSPELVSRLADAGLDSVTVSLYGASAALNDRMRCEPGLFDRAMQTIDLFTSRPGMQVDLQTILARDNIEDFPYYMEKAYALGVGYVYVSYVEGDVKKRCLPLPEQIPLFQEKTGPAVRAVIRKYAPHHLRTEADRAVRKIFNTRLRAERYSSGVYFPEKKPDCPRPGNFALILASGEVHPCNGVEYSHEPVMGNVKESSFAAIWEGNIWQRFRKKRHAWCHRCPVTLHFRIPVKGERSCASS